MATLLNVRTGFASNSSSYHSTVINNTCQTIDEMLPSYIIRNGNKLCLPLDWGGFGWENFVLTQLDTIDLYLAAQIYSNLSDTYGKRYQDVFVDSILPGYSQYFLNSDGGGIDHQSIWNLPYSSRNSNVLDIDFLLALRDYLHRGDIIILGGNDNDSDDDSEIEKYRNFQGSKISSLTKGYTDRFVSYKDGNVFLLFSKRNGTKLRFSFEDNITYTKSSRPELVDLIITNRCYNHCKFCYRNCSPTSSEAGLELVYKYIHVLCELQIPEIIIGGGDILEYPGMEILCNHIQNTKNMYPSVFNTTIMIPSNYHISSYVDRLKLIMNTFDGVAISIIPGAKLDFQSKIINMISLMGSAKISLQIVPELYPENFNWDDLCSFLFSLGCKPLTLLGEKTGRNSRTTLGRHFCDLHSDLSWFYKLKKPVSVLGVDTQFLHNFPELTEKFDKLLYETEEGKFSCCIDVAESSISPSSYSDFSIPLDKNYSLENQIMEAWKKF